MENKKNKILEYLRNHPIAVFILSIVVFILVVIILVSIPMSDYFVHGIYGKFIESLPALILSFVIVNFIFNKFNKDKKINKRLALFIKIVLSIIVSIIFFGN